jgi:hypothetical protein
MAGGMSSGGGETLAERVANTRAQQATDAAEAAAPSHSTASFHTSAAGPPRRTAPPPVKHCWYRGPYGRQAALLVRWRQVGGGYDGLILVPAPDEGHGWAVVEMWVESDMLEPA